MKRIALTLVAAAVLVTAAGASAARSTGTGGSTAAAVTPSLKIKVLSNRADLLSGGDALVEVRPQGKVDLAAVAIDVGGRDVTGVFSRRSDGRYVGLVEGLELGPNVLTATMANGHGARITLTNHPIGGPVFSGPQIQPWLCTTDTNGLGPPQDAKCNAPTVYEFFFQPASGGAFAAYNPAAPPPPALIANTTTDQGQTVPFVIRQETGTQNRGIYRIAVLWDPATSKTRGWNRKLYYPFGASCGTIHSQSSAQNVQNATALGRGFMVATSSMNVLGNNCNTVTSAESVMMLKERIVERYGEIRYTFGNGSSGGSIGQHVVANSYPGLLQGLTVGLAFPDSWTTGTETQDCRMLLHYFDTFGTTWTEAQKTAVTGHIASNVCSSWATSFAAGHNPRDGCGVPATEHYDPATNPTGCRGTKQDFEEPVWGKRPQSMWTAPETAYGGFAKWVYDNVGVQYGLRALEEGQISVEQFVDLNEKVGGMDIDWDFVPNRRAADPGSVRVSHYTGRVNDGARLDQVAIIDTRSTNNNDIHSAYHSWALKARLADSNGDADNHVIFTSKPAAVDVFSLMDAWLTAVEADRSTLPLEEKIVRHKPAEAVDTCWDTTGTKITDVQQCRTLYPIFGSPRIAAGGPFTHDSMKCRLKPLARTDYAVTFTDAQWARLRSAFPTGVCDWSVPAVDSVTSAPWLTFAGGPGGKKLPAPPTYTGF